METFQSDRDLFFISFFVDEVELVLSSNVEGELEAPRLCLLLTVYLVSQRIHHLEMDVADVELSGKTVEHDGRMCLIADNLFDELGQGNILVLANRYSQIIRGTVVVSSSSGFVFFPTVVVLEWGGLDYDMFVLVGDLG